eukprot:2178311-Pyramimonas_sp.AAC.2
MSEIFAVVNRNQAIRSHDCASSGSSRVTPLRGFPRAIGAIIPLGETESLVGKNPVVNAVNCNKGRQHITNEQFSVSSYQEARTDGFWVQVNSQGKLSGFSGRYTWC